VLVVPSIWLENSPLVIHEAFMAGVPVVGARMGGIPELVADGVNGLLYQADSAASLEGALRRILDDPSCLEVFFRNMPSVKPIAQDACDWETRYGDVLARAGREKPA
jgi:glycosyltransferase involved in cell wall biosynthesis